jgi:hypothetical protein
VTARRLNRATLARQLLLRRERRDVADAVRSIVGLQAQEAASPYIALWSRLDRFDAGALDAAFAEQQVVKATLMRITLHAVHVDDYPAFHGAMLPTLRASRLHDRRFTTTGLTTADADAFLPELLEHARRPRPGVELQALVEERFGEPRRRLWWALRTFAPLLHAPVGTPWSFGLRSSFVTAPTRGGQPSHDDSVRRLVRRYLEGFGPASAQDVAQFTLLRQPVVREALRALGGDIRALESSGGAPLFDVPGASLPAEDTPAPARLLPMWDSTLLAYADRSRIIPPEYRPLVIRRNGDVLPTMLVDGYVAGVWRPLDDGIEATAFHGLPDETWAELDSEARALRAFLSGRDTVPYRRYGHWWNALPRADLQLLGG